MHNNLWLGFYVLPFQKVFEISNFNHNIELANRVRRKNRNKYLFAQNGKYKAIAHTKWNKRILQLALRKFMPNYNN